jgi:hypothetical protein
MRMSTALTTEQKRIIHTNADEPQVSVVLECHQCSGKLQGEANSEEEAWLDLYKQVEDIGWFIGELDSEYYQTIFNVVCGACLGDIVAEEARIKAARGVVVGT